MVLTQLLFDSDMKTNIYDVIPKGKLDVVANTIEKAHGLPNECYLQGEYTNIERKKIFEDKWVVIGVANSIPNPGDAKPFDLLGIPLIIIRDKKPYEYLLQSIEKFINQEQLLEIMRKNNFKNCTYRNLSGGIVAIHSGWKI